MVLQTATSTEDEVRRAWAGAVTEDVGEEKIAEAMVQGLLVRWRSVCKTEETVNIQKMLLGALCTTLGRHVPEQMGQLAQAARRNRSSLHADVQKKLDSM